MPAATPLRLAMWSGPRNVSTALMRAWGNRLDTHVCDEPLYAHYLTRRSPGHPGEEEVKTHHETDWRKVVAGLLGPVPGDRGVFYQKHMAHHLLPEIDRDWLGGLAHAFLIRDPAPMLLSLAGKMKQPRLEDTGLPQQVELFEWVWKHTGVRPPVLDGRDLLADPGQALRRLCVAVGVEFTPRMLSWPPGRRETDGVWAKHWYAEVESSTGFRPWHDRGEPLPEGLRELHRECLERHRLLYAHRLGAHD